MGQEDWGQNKIGGKGRGQEKVGRKRSGSSTAVNILSKKKKMKKVNNYKTIYGCDFCFRCFLFVFALLNVFSVITFAQSGGGAGDFKVNCRLPQLGGFEERSNSIIKWEPPKGGHGLRWGKGRIVDDEWWTPQGLDVVHPTYKLFLFSVKPDGTPEGKCAQVAEIEGQLITPLGKVFRFEQVTFDRKTLLLKFTTVRRDQLSYQGEFQFFGEPVETGGGGFHIGIVTLKATTPDLGIVTLQFLATFARP